MLEFTHREALAAIAPNELVALRALSGKPGLIHLAGHLGLLIATGAAIMATATPLLLAPLLLAHGILLSFLFAPLHESIHGTAFQSARLNLIVAEVIGFLLLLPPRYFRFFHLAHHRHTQDPVNDPELASPKPQSLRDYLIALTGFGYWRAEITTMIKNALGQPADSFVPEKGRRRLVAEARWFLAGYGLIATVSVATHSTAALWFWVIPALIGQPFLRAYLMAEHTGCPLIPDMLANSRTTFSNPVVRWLAWNMPYHSAHHALPTVPFHALPRLNLAIESHLKRVSSGYLSANLEIIQLLPNSRLNSH